METRQINRRLETRRIIITEVNIAQGFILGKDTWDNPVRVTFSFHDSVVTVPQAGELWYVKRSDLDWILDKRAETGQELAPVETLSPGDKRLESSNDLYLNAKNKVYVNGVELSGSTTWVSITGKPTTFPSDWSIITGKPIIFPTDWSIVASKPTTFTPGGSAGGDLTGTYPNPTIRTSLNDPSTGTPGLRTLGTGAQQATAGNDSRLSDSRTPTSHKASHVSGGSDAFAGGDLLNATAKVNVLNNGTTVGTRRGINFIPGSGISYSISDNSGSERVDITITSSGGTGEVFIDVTASPYSADKTGATTSTSAFNSAISAANSAGGGTVYVPAGTYRVKDVDILSNVTILNAPGVIYKFPTSGVATFDRLFFVGSGTTRRQNVKFIGPVTFDPQDITGYGTTVSSITGMAIEAAVDFVIDGIRGVGFKGGNILTLHAMDSGLHCERGEVKNLWDEARLNKGYGCVQITGAKKIFFENIWSNGGYALNFESDRRSSGVDIVEDCLGLNLYADKNSTESNAVVKFLAHTNTIRRIKIKGFTSMNSVQEGVFFTTNWDAGGSLSYITLEDGYVDTPSLPIRRENGVGELNDIPGLIFRNVRVVNAVTSGWQLGSSAVVDDCTAENCGTEGFTTSFSGVNSDRALPWIVKFNRCKAFGNGTVGFMNYGNVLLFDLENCESALNGSRAFDCNFWNFMRIRNTSYQHGQSGSWKGTSGNIYFDKDSAKKPILLGPWIQNNVAASQTNVALSTLDPPGAASAVNTVIMDRAGSLISAQVKIKANADARTAGTLTVEVLKNGAALGTPITVILNATTPIYNIKTPIATGTDTFVSTDTIGLRITTDASWAPTTADIEAWVLIIED